jgi:redox-sensitive bicupin YhaK (pirin superfamily)
MGFGVLRAINDDTITPGKGSDIHSHKDMEIITIVISGELEHKDNMGNRSVIKAGEIQKTSAGTGITHSEFNSNENIAAHYLQIWIQPEEQNLEPTYQQIKIAEKDLRNKLRLIASKTGENNSIKISQDAEILQSIIEENKTIKYLIRPSRVYWIHVISGMIEVDEELMITGDGLAVAAESEEVMIKGLYPKSNILIFNLPRLA